MPSGLASHYFPKVAQMVPCGHWRWCGPVPPNRGDIMLCLACPGTDRGPGRYQGVGQVVRVLRRKAIVGTCGVREWSSAGGNPVELVCTSDPGHEGDHYDDTFKQEFPRKTSAQRLKEKLRGAALLHRPRWPRPLLEGYELRMKRTQQ